MLRDHCKIEKLLNDFEKCTNLDKQILKKTFNKFKWELEKHLFTEEKAIFVYFESDDSEVYKIIPQLMIEHDKIYKKLKEMKNEINNNKTCNFSEFKELMIKHKNFEEKSFYPKLDQKLDETTKKMILKRMEKIKLDENIISNIKLKCNECGKKIGIFNGYYYPKLSKRWLVCNKCYNKIQNEVSDKQRKTAKGKWKCTVCNYIYDPKKGDPDGGIPPGTTFEDIPDDWVCPICGVSKDKFEKL